MISFATLWTKVIYCHHLFQCTFLSYCRDRRNRTFTSFDRYFWDIRVFQFRHTPIFLICCPWRSRTFLFTAKKWSNQTDIRKGNSYKYLLKINKSIYYFYVTKLLSNFYSTKSISLIFTKIPIFLNISLIISSRFTFTFFLLANNN